MSRSSKWQLSCAIFAIVLIIYNILPTVIFYSKEHSSPIDEKKGNQLAVQIVDRVNQLESDAIVWLHSFCQLLQLKPKSIEINPINPQSISVEFERVDQAQTFRKHLPKAGSLINFIPAQLMLNEQDVSDRIVTVQRRIAVHIGHDSIGSYFSHGMKKNKEGNYTDFYLGLVNDRFHFLLSTLAGESEKGLLIQRMINDPESYQSQESLLFIAKNLFEFINNFGENSLISKRYFATFSQLEITDRVAFIQKWINVVEQIKDKIQLKRIAVNEKVGEERSKKEIQQLLDQENILLNLASCIRRNVRSFTDGFSPIKISSLPPLSYNQVSVPIQNPFFVSVGLDWKSEKIRFSLHEDIEHYLKNDSTEDSKKRLTQFIQSELLFFSRNSGEKISYYKGNWEINLNQLNDVSSFLVLDLYKIGQAEAASIAENISQQWKPSHPDLQIDKFPIIDYDSYLSLSEEDKKLSLVFLAPSIRNEIVPKGFKWSSVYVIVKGFDTIFTRSQSESSKVFIEDIKALYKLLRDVGFISYFGREVPVSSEFHGDLIFEKENYYRDFIQATRENFYLDGMKKHAILELSNLGQRILTENKIDDTLHEELLQWRDNYRASQVDLQGVKKYDVPPPTKNVLWDNIRLSAIKYFRGDERKIIRWGLDLSGGKSVQVELRDGHRRAITNEEEINQGIQELHRRINKMGVSEVAIRREGSFISLDCPASLSFSISDLIKASSMFFHIVNEKFMSNPKLIESTNRFLQDVWNEAVATNRKSIDEINAIARFHLYGNSDESEAAKPRNEAAQILYDHGLRLADYLQGGSCSNFDETVSKIALFRGEDFSNWHGETHPLLIVFNNYALDGSSLEELVTSYDMSKGNYLSFKIKGAQTNSEGVISNPREDLQLWTSQFAKEKIIGTAMEEYSQGRGYRMAVILNDAVITAPYLDAVLRDSASITGNFTQREISRLQADLKGGSLSFIPHILSEKNISPELGVQEKNRAIFATFCALILIVGAMIIYYRFLGCVASVALIFNLLIIWAVLQNLSATLTLAGIAGVILTLAMAVDANILVFERIREELKNHRRVSLAIHTGYRKALSAIFDSNVTLIIAALVLLHLDAGPIRGLAVTLIVGIISSLFSSLLMTRWFLSWWINRNQNYSINMLNWIRITNFNFLKFIKPALFFSGSVVIVGSFFLLKEKSDILGIDFKGGYGLTLELPLMEEGDYRSKVEFALMKEAISPQEFQVRSLSPSNQVRIFLSDSLDAKIKNYATPFSAELLQYPYENNPTLVWLVNTLHNSGIKLSPEVLAKLDSCWTAVSGQISHLIRIKAAIAFFSALLAIFLYINLRFELKYAISAVLCLIHDILFCVCSAAILFYFQIPVQIDIHTLAALITIIGYSLNDTIIVFDRIREEKKSLQKRPYSAIINSAINVTLSRTLITSWVTLLVLIPLIVLGGRAIFGFSLVMIIGVFFGTLSSLFIAAPLLKYFETAQKEKQ